MRTGGEKRRRATRAETLGAWLRLWTPPRDVEVPPPPSRRALLLAAAVLVVVVAGAAALIVPAIDAGKDRRAAAEAREEARQREARRREAIREQRPFALRPRGLLPPPGASAARRRRARAALLDLAERAITADAKVRVQDGELSGRPGPAVCDPYPPRDPRPEDDLRSRRGSYDCLVPVRAIPATETNVGGQLGYPFRAVLDFERFTVTWCKINPVPGERVVPDPRTVVELPKACRAA